jgi:hypothetical protein
MAVSTLLPVRSCTIQRAELGQPLATSTRGVLSKQQPCYLMDWFWSQQEMIPLSAFRQRRTLRPGERDLDAHG